MDCNSLVRDMQTWLVVAMAHELCGGVSLRLSKWSNLYGACVVPGTTYIYTHIHTYIHILLLSLALALCVTGMTGTTLALTVVALMLHSGLCHGLDHARTRHVAVYAWLRPDADRRRRRRRPPSAHPRGVEVASTVRALRHHELLLVVGCPLPTHRWARATLASG